jgi:hypothetical protein
LNQPASRLRWNLKQILCLPRRRRCCDRVTPPQNVVLRNPVTGNVRAILVADVREIAGANLTSLKYHEAGTD